MDNNLISWTGERFLPSIGKAMPEVWLEHISRYYMAADICKGKHVLDIASGEGYGTALLSKEAASVVGIDIDPAAVKHATNKYMRPNLTFMERSATDLDLGDRTFDVIVCFEMLEHIAEQTKLIEEVEKYLGKDGVFLISTPNKYVHDIELHNHNEFHVKELYFHEFQSLLESTFKYCQYFAQRQYNTAQIWNIFEQAGANQNIIVDFLEDQTIRISENERAPTYYIAVCSHKKPGNLLHQYFLTDNTHLMKKQFERMATEKTANYARVYIDTGEGYSEETVILKQEDDIIGRVHQFQCSFVLPRNAIKFRIDPTENYYCVIFDFEATARGQAIQWTDCNVDEIRFDTSHFFTTLDPQYEFSAAGISGHVVTIKFWILLHNISDFSYLEELFQRELTARITELDNLIEEKTAGTEHLQKKIESVYDDVDRLLKSITAQEVEYQTELRQVKEESQLQIDALMESNRNNIYSLEQEIQHLKYMCVYKDSEITAYRQSFYWRLTKPFRVLTDLTKKFVQAVPPLKLAAKFIISVNQVGISQSIKKAVSYLSRKKDINEFLAKSGYTPADNSWQNYSVYDCEYQSDANFDGNQTDIKALAFYLPQFHTFPENNRWWGEGFTEWVNTRKAKPRFQGHYQPRKPHDDIGYYTLNNIDTIKKQAALAKKHGIYGFCFYYYWFSGKRLMEKPVDLLMQHPEVDLPFCLCWANENWTRAWDGQNREVLIEQKYKDEDIATFIDDLKPYLDDPRYIRIKGKPIIIVYNPGEIPDCQMTFDGWRQRARDTGIGEILIWTCETANNTAEELKITNYIDAAVEFPPHNMWYDVIGVRGLDLRGQEANIYNYQWLVKILQKRLSNKTPSKIPIHKSCMLGWDNAARRKTKWTTFYAFSLKSFYDWLCSIVSYTRNTFKEDERFVFINAWNEWAEGSYLEPDEDYGYAYLNTCSKALFDLPFQNTAVATGSVPSAPFNDNHPSPRIAVQVHLFYLETITAIIEELNKIPYRYDCYISTDSSMKEELIRFRFQAHSTAENVSITVFKNRGRDVAPFLEQLRPVLDQYDYICHIHSKKTTTGDYGDMWREYLYRHLFGSSDNIQAILNIMGDGQGVGIVFPETYPILIPQAEWGGNKDACMKLLKDLGIETPLSDSIVFPVGNMFWAKKEAVRALFDYGFAQRDFPVENGQTNATLAHQIERSWVYVAQAAGYGYEKVFNNIHVDTQISKKKRIAFYVHYETDNTVSTDDLYTLRALNTIGTDTFFITNSDLPASEMEKVLPYCFQTLKRENRGFDFCAWKEALSSYGFDSLEQYDQLILLNNSCIGPVQDLGHVFNKMEAQDLDFWGITLFPYLPDGSYLGKKEIKEHIQSYFQVFESSVFQGIPFRSFWQQVQEYGTLQEVIANTESVLTHYLQQSGYKYNVYIKESAILSSHLGNYAIPYEKPYELLILGSPFVKKKAKQYASADDLNALNSLLAQLYE